MEFTKQEVRIITAINRKHLLELKIKQFTDELEGINNYIDNTKHIKPLETANKKLIKKYLKPLNEDSDNEIEEEPHIMENAMSTDAGT